MRDSEELEEGIKAVITNLFDSIQTENNNTISQLLGESVLHLQNSKYKLNDPENFYLFVGTRMDDAIDYIASNLHEPSSCKDTHKPDFIYRNYGFLERNIQKFYEFKNGSGSCGADISRYILKMYLNYAITGVIPTEDLKKDEYWKPKFGSNQLWMTFCDSLYRMYYGHTKEYFMAYNELLSCESTKFPYTMHHWYVEFIDGYVIELNNTWDDNIKCPLDHFDKGDFYLINKYHLQKKTYKDYIPEEKERYICSDYAEVPKTEIKRIFMESEEMML